MIMKEGTQLKDSIGERNWQQRCRFYFYLVFRVVLVCFCFSLLGLSSRILSSKKDVNILVMNKSDQGV